VAQRGRAISLVGGSSRIGTFVGPIAGGAAASAFGLDAAFYVQALVVGLGCTLPLAFGREASVPMGVSAPAHQRLGHTIREHWRSLVAAGSVAVLLTVLRQGRQVLLPFWGDDIGLDVAAIGLIFGLSSAADMTLFYPVGVVMDRWGRKWAIIPSLLILSASLALIPLAESFWPFLLVGVLSGIGNGFGSGVVMTLGADLAPRDQAGEFIGVWRLIADVGAAGAPIGIGALAQVATLGVACLMTAGAGFIGAAIMAFFVAETLQREPPETSAPEPASGGGG
jgi:MFS family permease